MNSVISPDLDPWSIDAWHIAWTPGEVVDRPLARTIREDQCAILAEDIAMQEQQQNNLRRHPERRKSSLNINAGGVRSRLMINRATASKRMIAAREIA